ncbi:unnamed protein product [Calicophoron daubneyi]
MTAVALRCTSILPRGKVNCSSTVDRRQEHRHVVAKMSGEIPADWNALNAAEKFEKRLDSSVFKRVTTTDRGHQSNEMCGNTSGRILVQRRISSVSFISNPEAHRCCITNAMLSEGN